MKKLMMFVMAVVFAAAFASGAYAAESAQLGLSVTFAVDQDLQRVEELKMKVDSIRADRVEIVTLFDGNKDGKLDYADVLYWHEQGGDFNGDGVVDQNDTDLLHRSIGALKDMAGSLETISAELTAILDRRPDLGEQIKSIIGLAEELHAFIVKEVDILARLVRPVISIELNNPSWGIQSIHLGDVQENVGPNATPIHKIANTGTVPVVVDIGYGPTPLADTNGDGKIDNVDVIGFIHPGFQQGLDTFMTAVMMAKNADGSILWQTIPPDNRVKAMRIGPNEAQPLSLSYGAPTKLSGNARGMSATYELRAYGAIYKEDLNGNGKLDAGEDTNGNGVLD